MLSRGSSDAGVRLRHVKSTSSGISPGKSSTAEPSDPFVVREHATAAAVEAFERAYAIGRNRSSAERSLELARHKSNASRGSQGSHFPPRGSSLRKAGEDSAARRRKSTQSQRLSHEKQQNNRPNKAATAAGAAATPQHPVRDIVPTSVVSAPPVPRDALLLAVPMASPSTPVSKQVRKSRSMYNSWSFGIGSSRESRKNASMDIRCSSTQKDKHSRSPSASSLNAGGNAVSQPPTTTPGADEIAAARDSCLQDFQKHKLKTRPSFVFTPFKKRQDKQQQQQSTVPSDDSPSPHATPPPGISTLAVTPARLEEKRSLSGSLRTKFKKVFRKPSKPALSLPVQQVDASRAYFGNSNQKIPAESVGHSGKDSLVEYFSKEVSRPESCHRRSSDVSRGSRDSTEDNDITDISKSRVTSWTNSSATGSVSNRLSMIPEAEPSSDKNRNTSSILGRGPFKKPMPQFPRALVKGPDSFDVFSALKSRLEKAGLDSNLDPDVPNASSHTLHDKTERATLPSQMRVSSSTSSRLSRATRATIRTVTPEAFGRSRSKDGTSEGHRQIEDDEDLGSDSPDERDDKGGIGLPRIRLQRASRATMPTPDQIASRKKKSENRWQAQLQQGHSPVFSKNTKRAMAGMNPYELTGVEPLSSPSKSVEAPARTCSRKPQEPVDMLNPGWPSRADIMSPSVYSRDSTGESPVRKESDGANCPPGTVVIVSSHSAKSYTLASPAKTEVGAKCVRSSKEWKSWLSKEVSELDLSQDFDMSMTEEWLLKPPGHQREHAEIVGVEDDDDEVVIFKSRPPSGAFPTRPERLTLIDAPPATTESPTLQESHEPSNPTHDTFATAAETNMSDAADRNRRSEQISTQASNREANNIPETPEPEEKIPLSTLTDHHLRPAPSVQSIQRAAGRSHSSLAQYTTSADDPDILTQSATTTPIANPPFRFRPAAATNTDPFSNRSSPFSRPRSAFDLRHHPSNAQLRSSAAGPSSGNNPALTATSSSGAHLTPPPPPPPAPHHHLRRKPVTLGGARRGAAPSPAPHHSLESETMQNIMQGPYGSSGTGEAPPPPTPSTPPWIPPPPLPATLTPTPTPHRPRATAALPPPPLSTRQSSPALLHRPSSSRLGAASAYSGGRKENASPLLFLTPRSGGVTKGAERKCVATSSEEGKREREGETPSPGQVMAERWLSARQQARRGVERGA